MKKQFMSYTSMWASVLYHTSYNPRFDKMRAFNMVCYSQAVLDIWLKQNNAIEFDEFAPGCLLDNFSMFGKRCKIWVFEQYVNANQSCFNCYAIPYELIESNEYFSQLAIGYDEKLRAIQGEEERS